MMRCCILEYLAASCSHCCSFVESLLNYSCVVIKTKHFKVVSFIIYGKNNVSVISCKNNLSLFFLCPISVRLFDILLGHQR